MLCLFTLFLLVSLLLLFLILVWRRRLEWGHFTPSQNACASSLRRNEMPCKAFNVTVAPREPCSPSILILLLGVLVASSYFFSSAIFGEPTFVLLSFVTAKLLLPPCFLFLCFHFHVFFYLLIQQYIGWHYVSSCGSYHAACHFLSFVCLRVCFQRAQLSFLSACEDMQVCYIILPLESSKGSLFSSCLVFFCCCFYFLTSRWASCSLTDVVAQIPRKHAKIKWETQRR